MNKPLLSICIPTYNRCQYLKKSLDSIIEQKEFLDGKVEVIISDNASEDETEQVGRDYAKKYSNIKYFRNIENVRDQNFPRALSRASGVLRRLSNDTVMYRADALKEMCQVIEKYQDEQPYICWANGASKSDALIKETDFSGFMRDCSYWITSIACFSIWESECNEIENDLAGCNLLLWQVRKGLELSSEKDKVLICNKALTDTQTVEKKNISYGLYHIFYENYFSLLEPYFENGKLTGEGREYLEKDLLYNFFTEWCIKWEMQENGLMYSESENLKELVWNQYREKPYWKDYLKYYRLKSCKMKTKKFVKKLVGRA